MKSMNLQERGEQRRNDQRPDRRDPSRLVPQLTVRKALAKSPPSNSRDELDPACRDPSPSSLSLLGRRRLEIS